MRMPNMIYKDADGFRLEFDSDISEDEKKFYTKIYPTVDLVCERKVHCTVCDAHIGTAPAQESMIRMHPILRVTHCKKCHEFYNSGEFSKGEDGSELYCRWCGQGGEVYCCSKCPYVFCKNCIVLNLSKGCVNDIEENENWNCFVCAPKIMWHLRAQHWALMNFIEKQKKSILSEDDHTDSEIRKLMTRDKSTCCKANKRSRSGNISDSSCDSDFSIHSKKKKAEKKMRKILPKNDEEPEPKRSKTNDEVVCTPDVLSMLEPDGNETETPTEQVTPSVPAVRTMTPPRNHSVPQIHTIIPQHNKQQRQIQVTQQNQVPQNNTSQQNNAQQPPPLIIRNFTPQFRAIAPTVVTRKTVVGPRPPSTTPGHTPVYHTINGFRIDLNSAAQQETFRLPNGKLIQVKKQGTATGPVNPNQPNVITTTAAGNTVTLNNQAIRTQIQPRAIQPNVVSQQPQQTIQHFQIQQPQLATIRYAPASGQVLPGTTTITATIPNGQGGTPTQVHLVNGTPTQVQQVQQLTSRPTPVPTLVRQFFSATPLGQARSQLQNQIFSSMDICQHLTGKIHTLTNSNAYKSVRNYTDVKELYIHLSYLFTYAIGRFKGLQDKCLEDMRRLGFAGDAASLESGQLEKHASDGDEDEVEIVEPKTTCIDLDSDNEDTPVVVESAPSEKRHPPASQSPQVQQRAQQQQIQQQSMQQITPTAQQIPPQVSQPSQPPLPPTALTPPVAPRIQECDYDVTANLLAGMLEVELHEGSGPLQTSAAENVPKKPRKKMTSKPNPHLIKQQMMQERERIKEMIRRDIKLNAKCNVVLDRIEEELPQVKKLIEEFAQSNPNNSLPIGTVSLTENSRIEKSNNKTIEREETEDNEEIVTIVETVDDENPKESCETSEKDLLEENTQEKIEEFVQATNVVQEKAFEETASEISPEKEDNVNEIMEVDEIEEKEVDEPTKDCIQNENDKESSENDTCVEVKEDDQNISKESEKSEEGEKFEESEEFEENEKSEESEKSEENEKSQESEKGSDKLTEEEDVSNLSKNVPEVPEEEKGAVEGISNHLEDGDVSSDSPSLFSEISATKLSEAHKAESDKKSSPQSLGDGCENKSCDENSQDSMKHSQIDSGDSLDYLAAMEE